MTRVLFVSGAGMPDYQCDMLMHGLRELLGADAVDVARIWYLYAGDFADGRNDLSALYGRGFSIYGLLGDDRDVDRSDIAAKIAARHFDLVVFGSVRRCLDHLDLVLAHYPPRAIAFVDGEDDQSVFAPLVGRGVYFKRELVTESPAVRPIHFAIPRSKIATEAVPKTRFHAEIDPDDRRTYVYTDEASYYRGYGQSFFGLTRRKAGWDCLRHYEIMANRCIPDFADIERCPPATMVPLPKYELWAARRELVGAGREAISSLEGRDRWEQLWRAIERVLHARLTTVALARYVLDSMAAAGA